MKIVAERAQWVNALATCREVVGKRNTLAILGCVKIEPDAAGGIAILGTDLDTTVRATLMPQEASSPEPFAVPFEDFYQHVSKLPDAPVSLELTNGRLRVTCGRSVLNLNTQAADDFPLCWAPDGVFENPITMAAAAFRELVNSVAFAASEEESRYLLQGVHFQHQDRFLRLTATDTHHLAHRAFSVDSAVPMPAYTLRADILTRFIGLQKHGDVTFGSSEIPNRWRADFAGWSFITQCMTGDYPAYQRVIPAKAERALTVNTAELSGALRRCAPFALRRAAGGNVSSMKVVMRYDGISELLFEATREEDGATVNEVVQCDSDSSEIRLAFDIQYFQGALRALGSESITIHVNGPLNPMVITATGCPVVGYDDARTDGQAHIVMPMGL